MQTKQVEWLFSLNVAVVNSSCINVECFYMPSTLNKSGASIYESGPEHNHITCIVSFDHRFGSLGIGEPPKLSRWFVVFMIA